MAVNESDANASFRRDLKTFYPDACVWNNTDKYTSGLPDTSASYKGMFFAIEGKFAKTLPKKTTSKCLSHEVTGSQREFISRIRSSGNYGCVIIFMQDVAVIMLDIKENYTLQEVLEAPRVERRKGKWDLTNLLELVAKGHTLHRSLL